jgi:cytochrome c
MSVINAMKYIEGIRAIRRTAPALCLIGQFCLLTGCAPSPAELTDLEAKALFNENGCNACHAVDEHRLGPAFRDVAEAFGDSSDRSIERMSLKIRFGGAGSWGPVPMVANPQLTDSQARSISRWILSLRAKDSPFPRSAAASTDADAVANPKSPLSSAAQK